MKRYGSIIGVKKSKLAEYKRLHAAAWPGVLGMIRKCNIRNYSVFLRQMPDGKYYLFSYFEYTGANYEADMKKMAADATTRKWWKLTDACQIPLRNRDAGQWWAPMEEVFHTP